MVISERISDFHASRPRSLFSIRNNKNLKHTIWVLIRHTEAMWDRSQMSTLELECSPTPEKSSMLIYPKWTLLNASINHMSTYVNKEKLANNFRACCQTQREKNMGLDVTFSSLFIGLLKLMNICMKFNWPTSSILSCDIPPLHNQQMTQVPMVDSNCITLCNDADVHETETVTFDNIGR